MDDNDGTSQDIQEVIGGSNNIEPKRSWNAPLNKVSKTSGSASIAPGAVFGSKIDTASSELQHGDVDHKDEEDQSREDEFSFGQDVRLFPMSAGSPNENCELAVHDADEVVVDVSPNGHSLDSLESFIRRDSAASHVKGMYVYDNTFTVLPGSVSSFTNLRSLKIFSNEVKLLPDEVGSIDCLENLQMKISPASLGKFPPLGKLKFLKTLELHQTPLRPIFSLPSEISKLQLLTRLAVCNFSISFLPPEIGGLKNLEELDLSFNKLKTLPKEISSLLALKHFRAENNKLIDLPSGFALLPNLSSVDIAHNKLTSLESLGLSLMSSLRVLNAKFNKLRTTGQIPDWVTCNLEGNPFSLGDVTSSSDGSEGSQDTDLLPLATDGDEVSSPAVVRISQKEAVFPKNGRNAKTRRGWRRQNIQQLQARQDRLNLSRNLKVEVIKDTDIVLMREGQTDMEEQTSVFAGLDSHESLLTNETEGNVSEERTPQISDYGQEENASEACFGNGSYSQKNHPHLHNAVSEIVDNNSAPAKTSIRSYSSRKVISGDRENRNSSNESTDDASIVDGEDGKTFTFTSKLEPDSVFVKLRRKGSSSDRNPKPAKRRRSAQGFSEVSYKYQTKSVVGLNDHLQDGFYDAGRDHPFVALEVLENQQLCFEAREVILVDRNRDEELDVIAVSARNFLSKMELAGEETTISSVGLSLLQKAMMLSLFVSDCFGGSDKTLNVTNARRAALGGCLDVPFLCSCSSTPGLSSNELNSNNFQGTVPTVHQLCETSARLLQSQRQSNVVPLGLLPYGVCRHRAILFKYLCDRASVPCELVRGYLDYVPHAWNVVLVKKGDLAVRMLVDSCRPVDIREENDPEYFCRYIPIRRFHLPSHERGNVEVVNEDIIPVLLDEIGRGASGSVVRRCTLGSVTAAAKVHMVDQACETMHKEVLSRFLSELRIFCSLREHPHIVSFYGHEFSSGPTELDGSKHVDDAMQLRLFMEYVPGISLEMVLASYAKDGQTHMPIKQATFVSKSVAHALSFVHSKGIVHRDVKSSNVLVDLEGNWVASAPPVKLCDFDSAVPLASSSAHTCYLAHRGIPPVEVCVGTPRWMAPEVFQAMYSKRTYGVEADMWSFGCLIFEMLTLQVPYAGLPEAQIHAYIQAGRRPPLPVKFECLVSESVDEAANDWKSLSDEELETMKGLICLFNSCTESNASDRPTAHEALKSLRDLVDSFSTRELDVKVDNLDKYVRGDCRQMIDTSPVDLERTFDSPQNLQDTTDASQHNN